MEPAIDEARRRGYEVWGTYFGKPAKNTMRALGITKLKPYNAVWGKDGDLPTLSVPQAGEILEWAKPDAVFVDLVGVGHAGGPWLVECRERGVTALEFGGCRARVNFYDKTTGAVTDKYIEQLRKVGFGQHSDGLLAQTDAWQWVGCLVGDRLKEKLDKGAVREALGLQRGQRYVAAMGNWGSDWGYANMASADLAEWDAMARQNGMRMVYSPHPVFWYTELPPHDVPSTAVLTANFLGAQYQGRQAKIVRTFDLVRAAEFLIFPYFSAAQLLAVAARVPMWLRRQSTGRADPAQFSRIPMVEGGKDPVQVAARWPYIRRYMQMIDRRVRIESCYRTAPELEKLFKGELGFPGSAEDWIKWDEEWRTRPDGKTAERIMDLIEDEQDSSNNL